MKVERGAIPLIADTVFVRTPAGHRALKESQSALSAAAMRLLNLLDGRRSAVQLLRVFPERDLAAYLAVLEVTGLIRHAHRIEPESAATRVTHLDGGKPANEEAWLDEIWGEDNVPGSDTATATRGNDRLSTLSATASNGEFGALRERLLIRMLRLIGPAGEPFALRITRCNSTTELRNLFPAILSVVELTGGPEQARDFARDTLDP